MRRHRLFLHSVLYPPGYCRSPDRTEAITPRTSGSRLWSLPGPADEKRNLATITGQPIPAGPQRVDCGRAPSQAENMAKTCRESSPGEPRPQIGVNWAGPLLSEISGSREGEGRAPSGTLAWDYWKCNRNTPPPTRAGDSRLRCRGAPPPLFFLGPTAGQVSFARGTKRPSCGDDLLPHTATRDRHGDPGPL
jgi:hypothetical protein